jgi:hypothetical protein
LNAPTNGFEGGKLKLADQQSNTSAGHEWSKAAPYRQKFSAGARNIAAHRGGAGSGGGR